LPYFFSKLTEFCVFLKDTEQPATYRAERSNNSSHNNGRSRANEPHANDTLLYALDLLEAPTSQLSEQEHLYQVAAASLFDEMEDVAAHPTQRPLYSTVAIVNILPTRLRSSRARATVVGMICIDCTFNYVCTSQFLMLTFLHNNSE
jgi:hypothetical protein